MRRAIEFFDRIAGLMPLKRRGEAHNQLERRPLTLDQETTDMDPRRIPPPDILSMFGANADEDDEPEIDDDDEEPDSEIEEDEELEEEKDQEDPDFEEDDDDSELDDEE
jgi:hypothetical protein